MARRQSKRRQRAAHKKAVERRQKLVRTKRFQEMADRSLNLYNDRLVAEYGRTEAARRQKTKFSQFTKSQQDAIVAMYQMRKSGREDLRVISRWLKALGLREADKADADYTPGNS